MNKPIRLDERDPKLKDTEIKVRISYALKEKAFELAKRNGLKLSEFIRKLIEREVAK